MTNILAAPELQPLTDKNTLTERVYRQLKRALKAGSFEPGQRITSRALANAFDVSMTPAREALWRLVAEDGLEIIGPKTIIVPYLSPKRYHEITGIRLALEGMAAESATENADKEFINDIEAIQVAFRTLRIKQDYRAALEMNEKFHFTLYERADMPRLLSTIESLWVSIGPSLSLLYPQFGDDEDGLNSHQNVIKGLRAGDPKRVREAVEEDIRVGYEKISPVL